MIRKYTHFPFVELMVGFAMFYLASCGSQVSTQPTTTIAQVPTKTLIPTETINPTATQTNTPIPTITNTSTPTDTLTPTTTGTPTPKTIPGPEIPQFLFIPSGNPVAEWGGITILPEAIAGKEEYGGYYYSVELPVKEVTQYYQQKLSESGWSITAIGVAEGGSIKLLFNNDSDHVTITVFNIEFSNEDPLWGFQAPASFVLIVQ
jgi:hypothetical protein